MRDAVDLCDPDVFLGGFPHAFFARLRREDPVHWHPEPDGPGFHVITRYRDVVEISKSPRTFSSARGTNIPDVPPEDLPGLQALMLNMDPPQHAKFRRIVSKGFTPRRIQALEGEVRRLCGAILDRVVPKGECDFVEEVAAELPLQVIALLLGVPLEDRFRIFDLSNRLIGFDDPEFQTSPEDGKLAAAEMWAYANELAALRKREPRDDLTTLLLRGEVDGEGLSELEYDSFFLLLAVAGNETTRNMMAHGLRLLIEHPDQLERVRRDPALVPSAIEEILRYSPPVLYFRRTATRDTEIRGVPIPAGGKVAMYYTSANRDEEVFPEPDRFDVGRAPNDHLAFGIGEHFCLGASLARLELRVLFEELLRRTRAVELAAPPRILRSNFVHGIKEMRVRFAQAGPR